MKKLFKRNMDVEPDEAFKEQYNLLSTKWKKEQRETRNLPQLEQKKIYDRQQQELQDLFKSYRMDAMKYETQFTVPLLTDMEIELDIPTHEKELDETFRKEIGKVIPLLREFTITGLEKYVKVMEKAMLSLAKSMLRYEALNRIASPYLPTLLKKDKGMIMAYYNLFTSRIDATSTTLTESLEGMISLMEDDGHRARLGASSQPPRQGDTAVGSYIQKFNDFVSRIDGIRMDSLEMAANVPLRNERRRQFINGLNDKLRAAVTQPEYDAEWHAFTQAYVAGFTRLYPNQPIFGTQKTGKFQPFSTFRDQRHQQRHHQHHQHNNANDNKFRRQTSTNQPPKFLNHRNEQMKPRGYNNGYNRKPQFQKGHTPNSIVKKIHNVETELSRQSALLNTISTKLSLFDIGRHSLTLVALCCLIVGTAGSWECQEVPPYLPLTYQQHRYKASEFFSIKSGEMDTFCGSSKMNNAYLLGNMIITPGFNDTLETEVKYYNTSQCGSQELFITADESQIHLIEKKTHPLSDADFSVLMSIFAYHYSFNFTCPSPMEAETTIDNNSVVPNSPVKRPHKRPLLEDEIREEADMVSVNREKYDILLKTMKETSNDLTNVTTSLRAAVRDKEYAFRKYTDLEKSFNFTLATFNMASKNNSQLSQTLKTMESQNEMLKSNISSLTSEISNLKNINEILQFNNSRLSSQVTLALNKQSTSKSNISQLNFQLNAINQDYAILQSNSTQLQSQIKHLQSENKQLKNTNNQLHARIGNITADNNILSRLNKNYTTIIDILGKELRYEKDLHNNALRNETTHIQVLCEQRINEIQNQQSNVKQENLIIMENPTSTTIIDPKCTAYNNFVIWIENVKNLNLQGALISLPNSVASLITFLSTLLGTRLVNKVKSSTTTPLLQRRPINRKTEYATPVTQSTPSWKFGDGPLLQAVNNIQHEALPKILLFIGQQPTLTLLDTGASINVIHERTVSTLDRNLFTYTTKSDVTARSANGTEITLMGKLNLQIQLDKKKYVIECYVSPDITHDLILGRPGLSELGDLSISWSTNTAMIGEHKLKLQNVFEMQPTASITLQPQTHNILNARISQAPHLENCNVFTITSPRFKGSNHLVTYSIISPVKNNCINFIIDNIGNNPVTVDANTILGYVTLVEQLNENEIRITNDGYSSDEADIVDRLPPYPKSETTSPITQSEFFKLIQFDETNMDSLTRQRLLQILWKNRQCFYEYNNTPGAYNGPETLELSTIPHEIPKKIRHPQYPLEKELEIEKQVQDMLKNDMIEPSRTPYLSRINLIKKKNDEWRFVVDFRRINKLIAPQSHNIPRIDRILDKAAGKSYYTSLDLKNGFHQLTLDKNSRYLTGFPTHVGIFQYKRIPMGLVGSPDFFNYVMENIFSDINNFVYLDDILLTDSSPTFHLANIEKALTKANKLGLRFSLSKCLFFQKSLEYLGFIISKEGVRPNPLKTEALAKKEIPKNEKELRSFLGAANYYRKHIPAYSSLASILYDTIGSFVWTTAHTEAFEKLKAAIVKACTLSPPNPEIPYTILTDASNQGLGAALVQDTKPIAFASRTLKKAESMYAKAIGFVS
uniref:RNA-directed DNA polymerase n=1 Tax=Strongyloides papillosus TaxID=174720 RepID=A0A0N5BKN0_STREA